MLNSYRNGVSKAIEGGIVGEWVWGSTIVERGAKTVVERCALAGVTDIYLLVKGTGGRLGYRKTKFTNLTDATEDILAETIDVAHAHKIRVHAWVCNTEDSYYKSQNHESGLYHYKNGRDNDRICLYDERYREYMTAVVRELAAYDIDGIHLDYIRYNHLAYGWSDRDFASLDAMGADTENIRRMIEKTFGWDGSNTETKYAFDMFRAGDKDALLIGEYRRKNVKEYTKLITDEIRKANPALIVSGATMPEGSYNVPFADLHYGQNYNDMAELFDYICPMAYSTNFKKDDAWVADVVAKGAIDRGNRVVIGLQAFDIGNTVKLNNEVKKLNALACDETYGKDMLGIALFRNDTFDYAVTKVNQDANTVSVKLINPTAKAYNSISIQSDGFFTITDVALTDLAENAKVEIDEKGDSVSIMGENLVPRHIATVTLTYDGEITPESNPIVVRAYTSTERCVYNAYLPF